MRRVLKGMVPNLFLIFPMQGELDSVASRAKRRQLRFGISCQEMSRISDNVKIMERPFG